MSSRVSVSGDFRPPLCKTIVAVLERLPPCYTALLLRMSDLESVVSFTYRGTGFNFMIPPTIESALGAGDEQAFAKYLAEMCGKAACRLVLNEIGGQA